MNVLYADTSALVRAYFVDEPEHATLHQLLLLGEVPVVTSEITRLEFASATSAAARAGHLTDAAAALAAFDSDCGDEGVFTLLRLQPEDALSRAVSLVLQQHFRTFDAVHVAVALDVPQLLGVDDVAFVTRDRQQALAAEALGLDLL